MSEPTGATTSIALMTYYYETTDSGVYLMAYGGNWTGAQLIAFWPRYL